MGLNKKNETIVLEKVLTHVYSQLNSGTAVAELRSLGPAGFDWNTRVKNTTDTLVPRFVEIASDLRENCVKLFNCSIDLADELRRSIPEQTLNYLKDKDVSLADEFELWVNKCRQLGTLSARGVENLQSQQVSAEIQRYLLSKKGLGDIIKSNGKSIYPDLIMSDYDYSFLPFQSRKSPIHGPCLRNKKNPKPSNVPDGFEIKTNKFDKVRVDAHGAHAGLHLAFTWNLKDAKVNILDIWIAYIRIADHTISDGTVDVTTKKRSFGHVPFISIIRGEK